MGSGYRKLEVEGEDRLSGHGVVWCATCDGFFFREQNIVVVGGGDSALEEATFLTRFASKVTMVHRRDELRGSKIMQDRAFANDKIAFEWNAEVAELHGEDKLEGITLRDTVTGELRRSTRPGCSSRSVTTRVRSCSRARSSSTTKASPGQARQHCDQPTRCLRLRRPGRPHLPPGHHGRRHGLRRIAGRRALPRRSRACRRPGPGRRPGGITTAPRR